VRQAHSNPLTASVQVALLWQGLEAQSSTFVSQLEPVQPASQLQLYPPFWKRETKFPFMHFAMTLKDN
jgi:hypothetical protein